MKLKHTLTALAVALPSLAFAQASATKEDYCYGGYGDGGCSQTVSTVTVQINVPPGDAGKPGAFFIGARATTGTPGRVPPSCAVNTPPIRRGSCCRCGSPLP